MRHRVVGKQLSRTTSHRKALRRNMAASLIQHGTIRTTEAKAKELRRFVEKIVTIAKAGTLHARRRVVAELGDRAMVNNDGELESQSVVQKLFNEIAPRYADRPGGYTRIIRLDEHRIGDAGSQVFVQLVEEGQLASGAAEQKASRRKRRAAKRHEAAAAVTEETAAEQAEPEAPEEASEETQEEPAEQTEEQQGEKQQGDAEEKEQ